MCDCDMVDDECAVSRWTAPKFKSDITGDTILASLLYTRSAVVEKMRQEMGGHGQHDLMQLRELDRTIAKRKKEIEGVKTVVCYNTTTHEFEVKCDVSNARLQKIEGMLRQFIKTNVTQESGLRTVYCYFYHMARELLVLLDPKKSKQDKIYAVEKLREFDIERIGYIAEYPTNVQELNAVWEKLPSSRQWTASALTTLGQEDLEIVVRVLKEKCGIKN